MRAIWPPPGLIGLISGGRVGGGGAQIFFRIFSCLKIFQNLDYMGVRTFYGIEKANSVVEI